ncbi:MAG: SDR family NAD(P)-dependent oxidoreductase [Phycisphaerales bacterium]
MTTFQGKVVLVTGAGSGIGRDAAIAFARKGATLVLGNRNEKAGLETVQAIQSAGGKAHFQKTDVAKPGDIESLVETAVGKFGRLDVAFNNAGVEGEFGKPVAEWSEDVVDQVLDINVKGVWRAMRAQIPVMVKQGKGVILNTSSVAGHVGLAGAGVYVASKHAVEGLSKSAALELAKSGVRVNCVAPGPIVTPMLDRASGGDRSVLQNIVPMARLGETQEISGAVLWLASDEASYITGQSLVIDGGIVAG